jgi:hypothetical protein
MIESDVLGNKFPGLPGRENKLHKTMLVLLAGSRTLNWIPNPNSSPTEKRF